MKGDCCAEVIPRKCAGQEEPFGDCVQRLRCDCGEIEERARRGRDGNSAEPDGSELLDVTWAVNNDPLEMPTSGTMVDDDLDWFVGCRIPDTPQMKRGSMRRNRPPTNAESRRQDLLNCRFWVSEKAGHLRM
jgi:hypothetical protein